MPTDDPSVGTSCSAEGAPFAPSAFSGVPTVSRPNDHFSRERYRRLCESEKSTISVFSQAWWLDAVCGDDNWGACLAEQGGAVVGALPFYQTRHLGFSIIRMPPLTQCFCLWMRCGERELPTAKLSRDKSVVSALIELLPRFDYLHLKFHHSFTNWLPFYWQGFSQTTAYTYVIDELRDIDAICRRFSHAKRKNLKRAEREVSLGPELAPDDFYAHHRRTLSCCGAKIGYSKELFQRIYQAAYSRQCGRVFTAVDASGHIHAAIFVVWDLTQAYYLISSIDPEFRASGATTYLIREALAYVLGMTSSFDFEGSMIEGVENSFRQFGTVQKPYFSIRKVPSLVMRLAKCLRDTGTR